MNVSQADLDKLISKSKSNADDNDEEEENVICLKGLLIAFEKKETAEKQDEKCFQMDGFHKVMFKIQTNVQDADEEASIGNFNNITFMPLYKKKNGKSVSSVFFYQPEMTVNQYVQPTKDGEPHFFDLA